MLDPDFGEILTYLIPIHSYREKQFIDFVNTRVLFICRKSAPLGLSSRTADPVTMNICDFNFDLGLIIENG